MSIGVSASNTININGYDPARLLRAPDWNIVPHRGMSVPDAAELTRQIKALAEEKAAATTDAAHQAIDAQKLRLRAQYLSSVSPDRKQLLQEATQTIRQYSPKSAAEPLAGQTLMRYLDKKKQNVSSPISLSGGGSLTPIISSTGGYEFEVSSGGATVLSTANGQWGYQMTPAELSMQNSFNHMFDQAYESAKNTLGNTSSAAALQSAASYQGFDFKA